jgi:hypothetical protein
MTIARYRVTRMTLRRLAVLLFVLALSGSASATAALGPTAVAGQVRSWSPEFMNGAGAVTAPQAVQAARTFNVIAALPVVYKPYVAEMKAANPNLQLFVYMKGVFTRDTTLPEDLYAHDANGKRIYGLQFAGTWLLDPSSPAMLSYQQTLAQKLLQQSGYDGIFLDTIGTSPLHRGYVSNVPMDPATGQPWTARAWLAATAVVAQDVASATGKPVLGNGLRDGVSYYDTTGPTSELVQTGMAGAMAESWLRGANDPITNYPSESDWQHDVNMLVDAGHRKTSIFAVTKLWTNGTTAQKDAWYTFALGSFLLGNDGHSYLNVTYQNGDATAVHPLDRVDLGTPVRPYSKASGIYLRVFSGGIVLVNPTTAAHTLTLRNPNYRDLSAKPVHRITVAPHSAVLLRLWLHGRAVR